TKIGKGSGWDEFNRRISEFKTNFEKAMDDDFNTAKAIGDIHKFVSYLNSELDRKDQPRINLLGSGVEVVEKLLGVLGIDLAKILDSDIITEAEELCKQRDEARKNKDFKKADEIRDKLKEMGYEIKDTPQGTILKPKTKD
ncbi:unnamed protein product, partial [marine sediment metagenome]